MLLLYNYVFAIEVILIIYYCIKSLRFEVLARILFNCYGNSGSPTKATSCLCVRRARAVKPMIRSAIDSKIIYC